MRSEDSESDFEMHGPPLQAPQGHSRGIHGGPRPHLRAFDNPRDPVTSEAGRGAEGMFMYLSNDLLRDKIAIDSSFLTRGTGKGLKLNSRVTGI